VSRGPRVQYRQSDDAVDLHSIHGPVVAIE
jgi:hypothetical protein